MREVPVPGNALLEEPASFLGARVMEVEAAGVERVEKCMVRKMGYHYFVDMHVEVDPHMTVQHSHDIAHDVKNRIRSGIESVRDVMVHIEPSHQAVRKNPGEAL